MQNLTDTQIKLLSTLNNGSMTATEAKALGFDGFEIVDLDAFEFITIKGGVLTIAQKGIDAIEILNTVKNGSITTAEAKELGLNLSIIIDLDSAGFITIKGGVITIAQAGIDATVKTSTVALEVLEAVKNDLGTTAEAKTLGLNPFVLVDLDAFEFITIKDGVITITQKGLQVIA